MKLFELLIKKYKGRLYEYLLESPAMILGERFKGGIFRPSSKVLRYSQITGAFKAKLGFQNIHAVGVIDRYEVDFFIYSPQDKVAGRSKVPLITEVLLGVRARVYVASVDELPEKLTLRIGALITKGFGESILKLRNIISIDELKRSIGKTIQCFRQGVSLKLATRLPFREEIYKGIFGIREIIKPVFGYMFYPTSLTTGYYELALMEGSIVIAPYILLSEGEYELSERRSMSSIDSLVEEIMGDSRFRGHKYSSRELSELAEIYERYGYTMAKIYLQGKISRSKRRDEQYKLRTLLHLLNFIENSHIPRSIGAYIIKNLNVILRMRR